eukprot:scaffold108119_cov18-Tisochrysis_lutea.AAC.2
MQEDKAWAFFLGRRGLGKAWQDVASLACAMVYWYEVLHRGRAALLCVPAPEQQCEHCRAAAKACASDRQAVEQVIKRVPLQDQSCHEFSQPSQSHQGRLFATRHLKCLNSEAWDAANLPEHADPLSCSAGWS